MGEKRVIEQVASNEVHNDDWFLKDSVLNGTTKISAENLAKGLIDNVDASDIAYDNSESGLTATNVQDAIDETFENAGKVDDVKVDGTSVVTNKVAEIEIPVKDVQVKTDSTYDSVVDASGNAKIDLSSVTAYGEVPNLPQAIATFKDGADAPMKSLKVAIEPQQEGSGDPSPTNIRPISGWSECKVSVVGKNLLDVSKSESGGIDANGNLVSGNTLWRANDYIKVNPNTNFTFSTNSFITKRAYYYDSDKNFIRREEEIGSGGLVFTTPSNCRYIKWSLFEDGNVITQEKVEGLELQIELGTSATAYEPYAGNTYTIDLDGTRYGGEVDVVNGIMTVDRVIVTFDDSGWTEGEVLSKTVFQRPRPSAIPSATNFISNFIKRAENLSGSDENVGYFGASYFNVYVPSKTLAEWKTLLSSTNMEIVYLLATPTTIQLTPTQVKSILGSNNVWADTGDINECVYRRDMTSTIDDIIARIEALEG